MDSTLHVARNQKLIVPAKALLRADADELQHLKNLGFIPGLEGGAEGFSQGGDVITATLDGRDLNDVWAEYIRALQLYNAQRDRLTAQLIFPVSKIIEDVMQGGDTVNFEEASEFGVPRGVRTALPTYFSLGYSFKWWDIGLRFTWEYLAESESTQVDALNNEILEADNRNVFTEVLKAVFNNTTRVATIKGQNFNVFPLYNGDSTVPPRYKNTIHAAPHTHYLTSGAATVDPGDLTGTGSVEEHLKHHGYGWQQGTAMLLLVNSAQMATIRTFRAGVSGAEFDFISAQGIPDWALTTADIAAQLDRPAAAPPNSFRGMQVQGRYGPWLVIEEDLIPAGYLLGLASGGEENAANVVGLREHTNAGLRGLRLVKGPQPDYPLVESYYQRGFGTGVRQRGAAAVMKITAGAYSIPTGLTY